MTRHKKQKNFSLHQVIGMNNIVDVDTTNWTNKTPEGLAKFLTVNLPDWKQIIITKNTIVIDPQKKHGNNIVSNIEASLKIGRVDSGSLCISVNQDLTRNGKIPQHIYAFFGQNKGKEK